jgi:ATP-dependent RNA helicase DDX51/DBP6
MFQIPRFTGSKNPGILKPSAPVDTSALALKSLLKRAESRKQALEESRGTAKKRPAPSDAKASGEKPAKRKKVVIDAAREETTVQRDSRKALAKEEKRLRKDIERGTNSTGQMLLKPSDKVKSTASVAPKSSSVEIFATEKSEKHAENIVALAHDNTRKVDSDINQDVDIHETDQIRNAEPVTKNISEQLHPFAGVRDESQKVLSQKRTDDDEDFIGDSLDDESPAEHPDPMTVTQSLDSWLLDNLIADNLIEDGIDSFFPVQRLVIPQLLRNNARLCVQPRDMCVSAPTGSGKTIAYAVPILQSLRNRSTVRLRALLLLPSRELATQVYNVFCRLSRGSNLSIAVCTGQTPLEDEQRLIMGACYNGSKGGRHGTYSCVDSDALFSNRNLYFKSPSALGISAVDILICTPGRLLDHIQYTEGFTLQHLRFLVLDEADRLLGNAYHSWVRTLVQSAHNTESSTMGGFNSTSGRPAAVYPHIAGSKDDNLEEDSIDSRYNLSLPLLAVPQQPLQRLLFSATLTDNPRKLAMLGIRNPLILRATSSDIAPKVPNEDATSSGAEVKKGAVLSAAGGYMLPNTLEESIAVCETSRRPLVLLTMLLEAVGTPLQFATDLLIPQKTDKGLSIIADICRDKGSMLLVFSSSVETTHRLCRLLQLFNNLTDKSSNSTTDKKEYLFGGRVAEMSRLMRSEERELIMRDAAAGAIKILVSSDHMARGIDLPSIKLVVNYDPPKHAKMYVHRVGRTARANRVGYSVTLLKAGQVGAFRKMRGTIGTSSSSAGLLKYKSNAELEKKMEQKYNSALQQLTGTMDMESRGDLAVGEEI